MWRFAVVAAMGLVVGPHSGSAGEAERIAAGRELAESLCAACHMRGNAAEKAAPNTVPAFRAIAQRPGQTEDGIVAWLRSVPPMMPNHHLTFDEADKLAAFILSLRNE
jgi:mono/diheme cytochrome c family protein